MSSTGLEVTQVFPDVVRQLFVNDPQVKRLTHICLSLHADENPEIVLLCINALQKDLMDIDPMTRGIAVRTMCSIRNQEVSDNALVTIHKGCTDSSVYVRKCAAVSIAKLMCMPSSLTHTDRSELLGNLNRLLSDYESTVVSVAMMSLWLLMEDPSMTEQALAMLHGHFNRVVSLLPMMDWIGQFYALHVCRTYCMRNFVQGSSNEDFSGFVRAVTHVAGYSMSGPIVQVCLAVLVDLGRSSQGDFEPILLNRMAALPNESLELFLPVVRVKRVKAFLINLASDSEALLLRKIRILRLSLTERNSAFLLAEAAFYLQSSPESSDFVHECIELISEAGTRFERLQPSSLQLLVSLIGSHNQFVSTAAVSAVRASLENQGPHALQGDIAKKVLILLCSIVGSISSSKAAAIWLINLCHGAAQIVVPNVLQEMAKSLHKEPGLVKFELFSLGLTVLDFHRSNAISSDKASSVPASVSEQLLGPIKHIVNYIGDIAAQDPLVGDMVRVLRVTGKSSVLPIAQSRPRSQAELQHDLICPSLGRIPVNRAVEDSSDSLRESKNRVDRFESKSMSSNQAVNNRTSSSVTVPTTLKQAPPKPVTTLEDLDLFFTKQEPKAPTSPEAQVEQSSSTEPHGGVNARKAAIDLSNADWLKL